jgi:cytochrome c
MSAFNKVAMAVLLTLLVVKGADLIAKGLIHPILKLKKNSYIVEGVSATAETPAFAVEEKLELVEPLLTKANVEAGKDIARQCLQCHSFEKGGAKKIGPNLWNIIGAKKAHEADFAYSKALQDKGGTWTYADLNHFLAKPREFLSGTKMTFAGLKKVQQRADVIAYLRTLSDKPQALPK